MAGFDWNQFPTEAKAAPDAQPAKSSGFDWNQFPTEESKPGIMSQAADDVAGAGKYLLQNVVVPVGRFVDRFTGAPTRAAVGAAQEGNNPVTAFTHQFGADPEQAPTGKDLARRAGVVDTSLSEVLPSLYSDSGNGLALKKGGVLDPTASGAAGLGLDLATDWTNLVPGALALKGAAGAGEKAAVTGGKLAAEGLAKTADVATGTRAASKSLEVAGEATSRAKELVDSVFNPKQAATFPDAVAIAKKNNIDPAVLNSSIEFGKDSRISRLERGLREGPTGEQLLDNYQKGYGEISDAVHRKVGEIAGGVPTNQVQSGELIQQGFKKAQDELLDGADITYKKVQQYAPGLYVNRDELDKLNSSLNGVEKYAKGLSVRGVTSQQKAEGDALIQAVDAVRSTNGSFKQSAEALQMLGKAAFKDKPVIGMVSPDVQKLRDIYSGLSDALINTVKKDVSPEFADELVANNQAMSSFFKDRKQIAGALDTTKAGEQVFQRSILNGDTKSIGVLKSRLNPDEVSQLKGSFLQSLIKPTDDGLVNFNQLSNALRQKKNQVAALFEPNEIQELGELVKLGQDYGPAVLSSSGTGASNAFRDFYHGALRGFADEKVLDALKNKARNPQAQLTSSVVPATEGAAQAVIPSVTLDTSKLKRGPIESRLKSAQAVAPSNYAEKQADSTPIQDSLKGEDRWALSGYEKVLKHDKSGAMGNEKLIDWAFQNPKTRKLLISASDMTPGSPAMQKIVDQIQKEWKSK